MRKLTAHWGSNWRTGRPYWLCKKYGHISYLEYGASPHDHFLLCGCGRWYPDDDPFDPGDKELLAHPRFVLFGTPKNYNPKTPIGQPPLTFEDLDRYTMPFVYLRDNPDEIDKMNFLDIRRLIISRLADYEEGMDAE